MWIDSGYMAHVVYEFCRNSKKPFMPAIGRGVAQQRPQWYNRPTSTGARVVTIGEGYDINPLRQPYIKLVEADADKWKTWVHTRLGTPIGKPGAMTLFQAPPQEHLTLAKHQTAESRTEEFIAGTLGATTQAEPLVRRTLQRVCGRAPGRGETV